LAGRTLGQDGEPAVVIGHAYDLTLWLVRKVEKFPRSFRFTVGDRVTARSLDLLETLVEAAYSSDKGALLEKANRGVNSLRYLLRLSVDLKLLSGDSQASAAGRLDEIGRMVGGWRKSVAQRAEP
jgi:hypothetical protein